MNNILMAWVGQKDLQGAEERNGSGPISAAVGKENYSKILLLSNYEPTASEDYKKWLSKLTKSEIELKNFSLSSPTNYNEIYIAAKESIEKVTAYHQGKNPHLTFHLSPGTPAMAAVWIILAKTYQPARLIESSLKGGVKEVNIPFELSAEYIPVYSKAIDAKMINLADALPPEDAGFKNIIHKSDIMVDLITKARVAARHDVHILLQGESGTGKELFARAIHDASNRSKRPFVAVNCGAMPSNLIESEFFGHKRGAFTDAKQDKTGYLQQANGGTLFLDEIGEFPLPVQVKLLRAIQEKKFYRVGSTVEEKIDIRIISATNKDLFEEMAKGSFREDLFHRIAVIILNIPPLKDRKGDIGLLIDHYMNKINSDFSAEKKWVTKTLRPAARNLLLKHTWPGNVRELEHTLMRTAIFSAGANIDQDQVKQAIYKPLRSQNTTNIMNIPLGEGFDIRNILSEVEIYYIQRALKESGGNKSTAAEKLGLPNYQTLSNKMEKYKIE